MASFADFKLTKFLNNAVEELGFSEPTPIQEAAFKVVMSGKDVVGIAQTGTGKTLAYLLPTLQNLPFSKQTHPRVLILVPTRELVVQIVEELDKLTKYLGTRILGVYGGVNIKGQAADLITGTDIIVATPGRFFDLVAEGAVNARSIQKLIIDEVDVMLDLGFRIQLKNIFDQLPEKRQNIMFSATMTEEVDELIDTYFTAPERVKIAPSGEPLKNIEQSSYYAINFYTKVQLLGHLLKDKETFKKVIVFISTKRLANRLYEVLGEKTGTTGYDVIHADKAQNTRLAAVEKFDSGQSRILIATDVIARGIDLEEVTHVINFDVPSFPENYIHRIGRSGRAGKKGNSILFYTSKEEPLKENIEALMKMEIPRLPFPEEVEPSQQLIPEERETASQRQSRNRATKVEGKGEAFHEKSEKNSKTNKGSAYKLKAAKYKKPIRRGDKGQNMKKKRK